MPERECEPRIILDITALTHNDCLAIKKRIIAASGVATILVHPFFREHMEEDLYQSSLQYRHSNRERDRIIDDPGVVFVCAEKTNIDPTIVRLLSLSTKALVCLIPTVEGNPKPLILDAGTPEANQWKALITKLTFFRIRKLIMGGREYYYMKDGTPWGCVVVAQKKLQEKFEVELIPELCYPNQPI